MNKYILVIIIYSSSFALGACSGLHLSNSIDQLRDINNFIQEENKKTDKTFEETKPSSDKEIMSEEDELEEMIVQDGADSHCYTCGYKWSANTDPNLY